MKERYWWPLVQTDELARIFEGCEAANAEVDEISIEPSLFSAADLLMISSVRADLQSIIDRDTLPSLCHLFVGFGNSTFKGRCLTEHLGKFAHIDGSGREFLFQAHEEGDFHPWQTFCYMLMGGVDPDYQITSRSTLRQLAINSTVIYTQAMEDLGHLLFSLSHLNVDAEMTFKFIDREKENTLTFDVFDLMANAVEAHHFGSFKVCRKFHLTEGLCAIAARTPDLPGLKEAAQGFFSGQMDVLILLHRILELASKEQHISDIEADELALLRDSLQIGRLFENHLYYVGHLTELACFGVLAGFDMNRAQRNAASACLNMCNALIIKFASGMARSETLLPYSHFRRGLTLWSDIQSGRTVELAAYSVDFDAFADLESAFKASSATFNFAVEGEVMRPALQKVVENYDNMRGDWPRALGHKSHFRRIIPDGWPRKLHYEFLDYGSSLGVELHFESPELIELLPCVRSDVGRLAASYGINREFETHFGTQAAKLFLVFGDSDSSADIVPQAMNELISETHARLSQLIRG